MNNKKIIISIEGNIGVGKTSLMDLLKKQFNDVEFIYEPVDEWLNIKDENGKDLLHTFYDDKKRYGYLFQNIAYITRMEKIVNSILNSEKKYIFLDRSLDADLNTFAKILYDTKYTNEIEWNAYNKWNDFFNRYFGNCVDHKIIYLRCSPDTAYKRIHIRNRESEKNIDLEYLNLVHQYHDDWLLNIKNNITIIDADKNFISDDPIELCNKIKVFMQN